ncbi:MAG: hypothetical protein ACLFVJ_02400 [Persicimonas sp.]
MRHLQILFVMLLLTTPAGTVAQDGDQEADDLPDVSGLWAQKVVTTTLSDVPIIGDVTSRTVSLQLLEIHQDGADLELTSRTCSIDVNSSVSVIRTEIPDRFIAAIGKVQRPASLVEQDGGFKLVVPERVEVLGARLRQPREEYLPSDAEDPRVYDHDKDGHPGMTVRVRGMIDGELYLVHRGMDRLVGTLDGDQVQGRVRWKQEQSVIDSTSIFLGDPPDSQAHPDASRNKFHMKRLDEASSCKAVVAAKTKLFGSN